LTGFISVVGLLKVIPNKKKVVDYIKKNNAFPLEFLKTDKNEIIEENLE